MSDHSLSSTHTWEISGEWCLARLEGNCWYVFCRQLSWSSPKAHREILKGAFHHSPATLLMARLLVPERESAGLICRMHHFAIGSKSWLHVEVYFDTPGSKLVQSRRITGDDVLGGVSMSICYLTTCTSFGIPMIKQREFVLGALKYQIINASAQTVQSCCSPFGFWHRYLM